MIKKRIAIALIACTMCLAGCSVPLPAGGNNQSKDTMNSSDSVLSDDKIDNDNVDTMDDDTKDTQKDTSKSNDDLLGNEVSSDRDKNVFGSPTVFNYSGIKFVVSSDYDCMYSEGTGPIVYMDNVFQMKFGLRDTPFNELLNDISATTDKAKESGATILVEPTEVEKNGKKYIYYKVELEGDPVVVVLSESPTGVGHLGGQIVIFSDQITDDDIVNMYSSIIESATATNEPDSTAEEIDAQQTNVYGEKKESSTLSLDDVTVDFKVPDGFYASSSSNDEYSADEYFECATFDVIVSLRNEVDLTAKERAESVMVGNEDSKPEMNEYEFDGKTIYVVKYSSEYNGSTYNEIYCFCDVKPGYIFSVNGSNRDNVVPEYEFVQEFFTFK